MGAQGGKPEGEEPAPEAAAGEAAAEKTATPAAESTPAPEEKSAEGGADEAKEEKKEKKSKNKEDKEGKSKEGKGKEGKAKGKEGKAKGKEGKDAKGKDKDGAKGKGKGKEKGTKGVKGSGPTAGGSGYRLNVKNLGKMTEDELKELFAKFGEVSMAEIKKNEKGESRGFGFVVLPTEKEGDEAAKEMNGKEVNGNKLNVAAAERRPVEEGEKGKGKGKAKGGYDMYAAQAMYAQQWAAYTQMVGYMQQYATMQQYAQTSSQEFEGSLKSVSSRNGYGFIVCRETYDLFGGRDVYVDESILPEGASRGSRLIFTVNGNEKGHPKAVACRLAPEI